MCVASVETLIQMTNFPNYSERSATKKAFEHSILYNTRFQHTETFSTLKMEARDTFETLLIYQNTRCRIPQQHNLSIHPDESLKS
jgi:hypothetical protein